MLENICNYSWKWYFGKKYYPNSELYNKVLNITHELIKNTDIKIYTGQTYSIETIFTQYAHIEGIINIGCNTIEIGTATLFNAAGTTHIKATAIFSVMDTFFGVTFLASEYKTTDGGRMDNIGIDENNYPFIFECKRSIKDNAMNQGLFYLNWPLGHKDSFKVLVI